MNTLIVPKRTVGSSDDARETSPTTIKRTESQNKRMRLLSDDRARAHCPVCAPTVLIGIVERLGLILHRRFLAIFILLACFVMLDGSVRTRLLAMVSGPTR